MEETPTWEQAQSAAKASKADEATPASTETVPDVTETKTEVPETVKDESPAVDYAAELAKYKDKLSEAEKIAEKRLKALERISKAKDAAPEVADEPTEKSDDFEAIIERKTTERLERFQREQAADVIDDILDSFSDDANEKSLVKTLYENGEVKPSGYTRKAIEADIKKAFLLANAPRLESIALEKAQIRLKKQEAEKKAILQASSSSGATGREPPQTSTTPALNDKEQQWMDYLAEKQKR